MQRSAIRFPDPNLAGAEGLVASGGDLHPDTLVTAYRQGIFPWFNEGQPILWWSPDPRAVLYPNKVHVSKSLKKQLRRWPLRVTCDRDFDAVITACAGPRAGGRPAGTWITMGMRRAYLRLHSLGIAHSIECWDGDRLAGGLYGVVLGRAFFGESMFSHRSGASKVALICLCRHLSAHCFKLIDCQVSSEHILRMGAELVPRRRFILELAEAVELNTPSRMWRDFYSENPVSDRDLG